jgi:hypothetical protein
MLASPHHALPADDAGGGLRLSARIDSDAVCQRVDVVHYDVHRGIHRTVLDARALESKAMLTWGKPHFGGGDWLRGQTEHCILAVRGNLVVTLTQL